MKKGIITGSLVAAALGLVLAGYGGLHASSILFSGELRLAVGEVEGVCLSDNAGEELPFSLRLERVDVLREAEPKYFLNIDDPSNSETVELSEGVEVLLGGEPLRLDTVRPWSGLWRDASGRPMAAIAVRGDVGDWQEHLFIGDGAWLLLDEALAIGLRWFDSEAGATEAMGEGLPGIESARWGVVEGASMHWLSSFAPGTGLELVDGSTFTLLRLVDADGAEPILQVAVRKGEQVERISVPANGEGGDGAVRFEFPARSRRVYALYGWQDGRCLMSAYAEGRKEAERVLHEGEAWSPSGDGRDLRLDQVLAGAVPVALENSPLMEAVLRGGERTLRIRQGEAVLWNESRLRLATSQQPALVRYGLSVVGLHGGEGEPLVLGPDDVARIDRWQFRQAATPSDDPGVAVIRAELRAGHALTLAGGAVFAAGVLGALFGVRHRSGNTV